MKNKKNRKRVGIWGDNYYIFKKGVRWGRLQIEAKMKVSKCMGRFGGGWNWALGFRIGGRTILIDLLVMFITVSWRKKTTGG